MKVEEMERRGVREPSVALDGRIAQLWMSRFLLTWINRLRTHFLHGKACVSARATNGARG
jgi:hypothetical protein